MTGEALQSESHRRYNPLRRDWVLVSPHRTDRPWQGQVEVQNSPPALDYDPACYLCPGNTRTAGRITPKYTGTYLFDNDFPALKIGQPRVEIDQDAAGLLRVTTERGICRVMCFTPRHDLTLAQMEVAAIRKIVDTWAAQHEELGSSPAIRYVQVFENRGAMMGASNPHPHCQIWATESIPNEPGLELAAQKAYLAEHSQCLLCRYRDMESAYRTRVVAENGGWLVVVPFWAVWPYEVLLLPKRHLGSIGELGSGERDDLAAILQSVTRCYDRVFDAPFPYSMGLHGQPCDSEEHPEWHFHAHFYPPLLRSPTVRKFMVGFELLGSPQRDLTPEFAAEILRKAMQ